MAGVGLTVRTVFTESVAGSTIPVIDELKAKQYKTVILVFGENELGWVYPEIFKEEYAKVIDAVRERQPSAGYLCAGDLSRVGSRIRQK